MSPIRSPRPAQPPPGDRGSPGPGPAPRPRLASLDSPFRRHAALSSATSIGLYAMGLATGPLLARALGPAGRGDIAAVVAPATLLAWVIALGVPAACAYFVGPVPEGRLLSTAAAFGLAVGVPVSLALWWLVPAYLDGHPPVTLAWARVLLVLMPLTVGASAALEMRRRLSPDAGWNLWRGAPVALPAVAIVALAATGRLTVGSAFAAYLVGGLSSLVFLGWRLWRLRPVPRPDVATLRHVMPYAWRTGAAAATTSVTSRLDQVVLVTAVPPGQLGLYAVAVTVASVTNPFSAGLALALFGHLRGEGSASRGAARVRRSVAATAVLSSVVAVGLGILAPMVLRVAFGSDFEGATTALRLLLPGAVAFDVLVVLGTKLNSEGRPGEASLAAALGAAVTVVGLAVAVPRFGIEGAAATTSVAFWAEVVFVTARGGLRWSGTGPRGGVGAAPAGGERSTLDG